MRSLCRPLSILAALIALAAASAGRVAADDLVPPAPVPARRPHVVPQQPPQAPMHLGVPARPAPARAAAPVMARLGGAVWVEGPGFDVKYGQSYDACAQRCLAQSRCVMIEYYRPERKCNLYDKVRPTRAGGSSDVALRK